MAATLAGTPVTDALVAVFEDAIDWREPARSDCCEDGPVCGDHEADQVRADAMTELLAALAGTDFDEAMLTVLAIAPLGLLAEILPATQDEDGGARDDG